MSLGIRQQQWLLEYGPLTKARYDKAAKKYSHMIVVCDTFDYSDYPVYVKHGENLAEVQRKYDGNNMQSIMETFTYCSDLKKQLFPSKIKNAKNKISKRISKKM